MKAWKASGLTAEAYATEHDLSPSTLTWWSCAIRARGYGPRARRPRAGRTPQASAVSFLPVRVVPRKAQVVETPAIEAEILLQGGRRVRVSGAMSLGQLAQLLDAIDGGARC